MKRRVLLLLQFSSASFLQIVALARLLSSGPEGTFSLPERSEGFLLLGGASTTWGADWKNLCRAACVFWAEDVQGSGAAGAGLTGFRMMVTGIDSTEEWCEMGWVWLSLFGTTIELAGPFFITGPEERGLQPFWLFWWALQMKVSGSFPGL